MAESESKVFKPRPKHLVPVILGLIATGVLAYPISLVAPPQAQVTPFDVNSVTGASLNAVVFVLALGASATVMFLLIRRGRMRFIRRLVKGALVLVSFAVALWYSTSILGSVVDLSTNLWTLVSLLLSLGIAAAIGLTIFGKGQTRQLSGVTALGALTGVFLGYSIGPVTALVLVGALVVYDIVAVFRGPVGALAKAVEAGDLPMYTYGELTIGMGDLVFYSLVATTAMVFYGPLSFLGAALGILAGSYLGFKALSRFEMFPGLPFSLLLGVAGMLLTAVATRTPILL
jgi:presenilin-like A22 family membrane protease